jgi:hypothetical protein
MSGVGYPAVASEIRKALILAEIDKPSEVHILPAHEIAL